MDYNSKSGIQTAVQTLEGFNQLIKARHEAAYKRRERLAEFVVLGGWQLDTCGNCMKATKEFVPKDKIFNLDPVLTKEEFWEMIAMFDKMTKPNMPTEEERAAPGFKRNGRPYSTSIGFSFQSNVPPANVKCPICNLAWSIDDCFDVVQRNRTETIKLSDFDGEDFTGKTIAQLKEWASKRTDGVWFSQPELVIRNDRLIDKTLVKKYDFSDNLYPKNEHGWLDNKEVDDSYTIQPGDEYYFNIWAYYHPSCSEIDIAQRQLNEFKDVFTRAGMEHVIMKPIPNGYCPCEVCGPWFEVQTPYGMITLGWRKRVINVDCNWVDLRALFPEENVTMGKDYIHAWGYDKAVEYIKKIVEAKLTSKELQCQQ